jgi:F420-dependent methylenetetrahydromethanopterin dehydrogenase
MGMKLFTLAQQYRELEALVDSDEVPAEVILDTLEGIKGEFEDKAVAVAQMVLMLKAQSEAVAAVAKAQAERAARIEKRMESLKHYLLLQLQVVGRERIETDELVIRRQNNPPSVYVTNEYAVPKEYWVQPPAPPPRIDKLAIKEAIEAGVDVDGCFLEKGEHVRITL